MGTVVKVGMASIQGSVKWKRGGGVWVASIDRPLIRQHFRRLIFFFKRLNNFSCVLTESCGHRGQKFNTVVYSPAICNVFPRYRSIAGKHIKNRPHTLQWPFYSTFHLVVQSIVIVKCGLRTQRLGVRLFLRPMHTGFGLGCSWGSCTQGLGWAVPETYAPRVGLGWSWDPCTQGWDGLVLRPMHTGFGLGCFWGSYTQDRLGCSWGSYTQGWGGLFLRPMHPKIGEAGPETHAPRVVLGLSWDQ